jgi:chromosome segregation ATPase
LIFYAVSGLRFLKKYGLWGFVLAVFLGGCATQGDVASIQRDSNNSTQEVMNLQRNLYDLKAEIKKLSSKVDAQVKKQNDIQQQISAFSTETNTQFTYYAKRLESSSQPMRQYQAGMGARVDKLQAEVQNLTGRLEESKNFSEKTFRETRTLRENYQAKIENLEKKITRLNKALDDFETKQASQGMKKP